uniref:Putative transposase n=1 Tax=Corynebacterium glutamicum TaxID=1718 RepID=D2KYA2_CORGT|nr:putative transposase [Corynebacterium glutamicum]
MDIFSGRHFPRDIILWAVRWYCRYGVSYRDLEEMMTSAGRAGRGAVAKRLSAPLCNSTMKPFFLHR